MVADPQTLKMTPRTIYDIWEFEKKLVECYKQFLEKNKVVSSRPPETEVLRWREDYFQDTANGQIVSVEPASLGERPLPDDATFFERWLPEILDEIFRANAISDGRISLDYWW